MVDELDDIDEACGPRGQSRATIRERWDSVAADLEATSDEEIDHDTRLVLRRRLAEVGIELLAWMYADGDASDALPFGSTLATLAPTRDLKEEIHGASNDQANFRVLCRARRDIYSKPRDARAALKKVMKGSKEGGLVNAAKASLDLPKPVTSAPTLFTFNSVGVSLFGERDPIGDTFIKTHAICVLFLPIIPIGAYRVQDAGDDGYYFISKNKLSLFARLWQGAVLLSILALVATLSLQSYLGSDSRQARLAVEDAQSLVERDQPQLAIAAYEEVINKYGINGGSDRMQKIGKALLSLYLAEVASPMTLANQEQAHAIISRFRALPAYVRNGTATTKMSDQLVDWAKALDGPSVEKQVASLRMLKEAEALGISNSQIADLRVKQELGLAAAITKDRPVDGLGVYLEVGAAGLPAAGEILRTLNVSQLHSVERLSKQWLEASGGDPEIVARIEEAQLAVASEEHQALLQEPKEKELQKAIVESGINQHLQVALADIMLSEGRNQEALALLESMGRPGELVLSAQLSLAQAHTQLGNLDEADELMGAYLSVRLGRFQEASKQYNTVATALQESLYEKARTGNLPHTLDSKLGAISDEDEQYRVFEEWIFEEISKDPEVSRRRAVYDEHSDIVAAVLQQGMVKLQLANMSSGEKRETILAEAERSFLAISADAKGLPSYHLNLGQVYHRLGKTEEGDAEFAEILGQKDPAMMLEVAYTYRELQLGPKASAIAEEVYNLGQEPLDSNAAVLLSLLSTDLEGEEEWLKKADQSQPSIKMRLTNVKADRARQEGRDADADKLYARVAAFYNDASKQTANFNNGAIANQSRYAVTGKQVHLDSALQGLERAYALTPQSAIVATNVAALQAHQGQLSVLSDWIKISEVRPSSSDSESLVAFLAQGSQREKVLSKLQKNLTLRKSRSVGKQVQLLAPNSFFAWESELDWYSLTEDIPALRALLKRVQAANFNTAERDSSRKSFEAGENDEAMREYVETSKIRLERLLTQARKKGHGPTIASLALLLSKVQITLQLVDLNVETAQESAQLLKEAHTQWPDLGTNNTLVTSLFEVALFRAIHGNEKLTAFCSTQGRIHGIRVMLLRGPEFEAIKAELMPKLKAQPEFSEAIALAIKQGSKSPSMTYWLLGELAGNAELMQLNVEGLTREDRVLEVAIRSAMDPGSKSNARRSEIMKAHAK